jgi:hypothetical protein
MNYQYSTQSSIRSAVKYGSPSGVRRSNIPAIPGSPALWKAVLKTVLMMFPALLLINIMAASAIATLDRSVNLADGKLQQLEDQNIELLAKKARVSAPDRIEELAAEKLSLYSTTKYQVGKFNRRSGTFIYL